MTKKEAFDEWWSNGSISKDNPFIPDTQQFWAYEGYISATQRAADIAYNELDDPFLSGHGYAENVSRAINE